MADDSGQAAPAAGETERIAAAFLEGTLPKTAWTHQAHLRVGLWHVFHHGPHEALRLLRDRIRTYNAATGVPNTDTGGYHETITRFFVERIAVYLATADRSRALDELAAEVLARLGDSGCWKTFYTDARLKSVAARRDWIEPDLRPIDVPFD